MTILDTIVLLDDNFNARMTENKVNTYIKFLDDLKPEAVEYAAGEWIKSGKPFMPKVSELRTLAAGYSDPEKGRDYLRAEYEYYKQNWYHDPEISIKKLEDIATQFERMGRIYAAEDARKFAEWAKAQ